MDLNIEPHKGQHSDCTLKHWMRILLSGVVTLNLVVATISREVAVYFLLLMVCSAVAIYAYRRGTTQTTPIGNDWAMIFIMGT